MNTGEADKLSCSPAQYETKFRHWGLAKNLGKREWQKLFWQQEEIQQQGREARIVISGSVVGEPSRKRARRWIEPEQHIGKWSEIKLARVVPLILCLGYTIPPERQAHVEVRDGTGPWLRYTESESAAEYTEFTQNPAHQNIGAQSDEDAIVSASVQATSGQISHETGEQQSMVPMELAPPPAASPSYLDLLREYDGSSFHNDGFQAPQQILQNQFPFPWEHQNVNDTETGGELVPGSPSNEAAIDNMLNASLFHPEIMSLGGGFEDVSLEQGHLEATDISAHESPSSSQELQKRPKGLAEALLQRARQTLADNATPFQGTDLPDVDDVMDNLESLLPESIYLEATTPDSQIIERNASFGPGFKALLYSITNGFAGLRNIPRSSILKLIRDDPQIQSHLIKLLNMSSYSLAKSLADNLFRAAVESCDPQAVAMIMNITRNSPEIAIDPNNIACELGGRDYTPVELAAKFRNIEIVQALLTAKADPNKTYSEKEMDERGALELAIRKWGKLERVDLKLVKLLLDCGAEVRVSLAEAVVRWGYGDTELLQVLMNEISDSKHSAIFNSRVILGDAIEYLENEAATHVIQRFFEACKSTNCGKCASNHPKLLQNMLVSAAKRGNLDLVKFLTPHTVERQLALAAAVRNGKSQLINFLLDKGATVDGPGGHLDSLVSDKYGPNFSPITTPLAEAIRAQDHSQVQEFEQRGALDCVTQRDHFLAAVFAAAEIGDVAYLQRVLGLVPAYRHQHLTPALNMAIRNDQTEAAMILLDAGADVNYKSGSPAPGPPLLEALRRRNKRVVDAILESDLDPNGHLQYRGLDTPYLEPAGIWGDLEIIEDLALMGADLDAGRQTTALTAAVMNRNKPLVDHLLRLGATANAQADSGLSPLEAAVKNDDHDMMVFLMSQGASVTNSKAFVYAAKHNLAAYNMFLSAFEKLPPMERKGFGGDLPIYFIAQNDLEAVDALIKAKVDINRVCWRSKNGMSLSPLGFAIKYKKGTNHVLVRKLLQASGDPNSIAAKSNVRTHNDCIRRLETPLLLAIQTRNEEMVKILVNAGALVNRPARRGIKRTPLQEACKINSFKIAKFLLLNGASVNDPAAERGGHTALQLAAINGSIKIATMLLDNGADPHGASAKVRGRTAFEGAAENGCLNVLRVLYIAAFPVTFDQEELQRARHYAVGRGHRSCVDYIDSLPDASSSGLAPLIDTELLLGERAITVSH
jgi:ankyrin repeat protein